MGSITAMYTALAEGDNPTDPVVDAARACLDGHIVLARKLAQRGHFPAVDLLGSVSRVMNDIVSAGHRDLAQEAREVLAAYRETAIHRGGRVRRWHQSARRPRSSLHQ